MSGIKEIKRQLEATSEGIEALDADLAAGRLSVDEHGRRRAEREREAGRLFVTLRRAQRESGGRRPEQPAVTAVPRVAWHRSPPAMVAAALLLLVVGVGGGVTIGRWFHGKQETGAPAGTPRATSADAPSAAMTAIGLQALQKLADREGAPIPIQLQAAHEALDRGQLDEARRAYQRVLARDPRNAEAITHLGGVLYQEGRIDDALAKVEEALRIDPAYIHALWDRTQYLFNGKRDFPAAAKAAEAFLKIVPEGPDADNVRKLLAEARQQGVKGIPVAPKLR
jgi:tetratricopeptide (TPR) repeat protein